VTITDGWPRAARSRRPAPGEAGTGLIISHGAFLARDDFARHIETAASSDGTPMAWIDWDAVITALDSGHLPASGAEQRPHRGQSRRRPPPSASATPSPAATSAT
jgi:hypothetical protein